MQISLVHQTANPNFFKIEPIRAISMLDDSTNHNLLDRWQQGDEAAAQVLVDRYMARLTALARSRLSRKLSRRLDPEDIVLSAWRSFFVATRNGRVTVPDDDDLWPFLLTLTLRKLTRQVDSHTAQRRDLNVEVDLIASPAWQAVVSRDPTPEQAAILVDEVESLMCSLNESDRDILARRLQGEEVATIAAQIGCSERTVGRSLNRVRELIDQRATVEKQQSSLHSTLPTAHEVEGNVQHSIEPATRENIQILDQPTVLEGDILLRELIGQGGFGKVYRAMLRKDKRTVAIKFLKKRFWQDARATASLIHETTIVSCLSHPNIIKHHGWGRSRSGAPFVVMDCIDGLNSFEWAVLMKPPVIEILNCCQSIVAAIEAAHAAGVVHGDLTPGNVLRRCDGQFILTDFGFSRSLDDPTACYPGGTPGFLAPEQVSTVFGPIDERTDVYGIGGLLYSLLTGRPPMTGKDLPEILANVVSSRPPERPGKSMDTIEPELDQLILNCLSKEPDDRPSTAHILSESLSAIIAAS